MQYPTRRDKYDTDMNVFWLPKIKRFSCYSETGFLSACNADQWMAIRVRFGGIG